MGTLPITGLTNGLYQVCTNANIAYAIAIPVDGSGNRADELQLWFEQSATDPTPIGGMVSFGENATVPTGLTGTDTQMGYQPAGVWTYGLGGLQQFSADRAYAVYVHVACSTAGAIARGMWSWSE